MKAGEANGGLERGFAPRERESEKRKVGEGVRESRRQKETWCTDTAGLSASTIARRPFCPPELRVNLPPIMRSEVFVGRLRTPVPPPRGNHF